MKQVLSLSLIVAIVAFVGCVPDAADQSANVSTGKAADEPAGDAPEPSDDAADATKTCTSDTSTEARTAECKAVDFSVAWCTNEDPKAAAETAVKEAMAGLAGSAKGLIFYEYYPKTVKDAEGKAIQRADLISQDEVDARRGLPHRSREEQAQLRLDISIVLAMLPDNLRIVAELLKTKTRTEIAKALDIPRSKVYGHIERLRTIFEDAGLGDYL